MNHDNIQNPQHYTNQGAFECIDVMQLMFSPNEVEAFCLCNAFKYLWRAKYKNNLQEDLDKAEWYLNRSEVMCNMYHYTGNNIKHNDKIRQQLRSKLREMKKTLKNS